MTNLISEAFTVVIKHFHLFCGAGGGALGFNRGHARVGLANALFRCLGGVCRDHGMHKVCDLGACTMRVQVNPLVHVPGAA